MSKQIGTNKQRFIKGFRLLCNSKSPYQVWSDMMLLFATALTNPVISQFKDINKEFGKIWEQREKNYLDTINKYNKKEQKYFPQLMALLVNELEQNPDQDLLGEIYMLAEISNKNSGQFFTPYDLCDAMAKLSIDRKTLGKQLKENGYVSIADCACGAGATLISASEECKRMFHRLNYQNHVYFVGQDIDITCVHMCLIQLALHGVAGYVIHGNTLTEPVPKNLEQIWFTPVWFTDVWTMRRLFHGQDILGRKRKSEK